MSDLRALPTWPICGGSLAAGFGLAELTGVRSLGGIVLAGALAWCAWRWLPRVGPARTGGLAALYVAAFAGSHALADPLGTWGAVACVSAVCGGAAWAVADRERTPPAPAAA